MNNSAGGGGRHPTVVASPDIETARDAGVIEFART